MSIETTGFFASPVFLGMILLVACAVAGTSILYFCRPQRGPGYWCLCCWLLLGGYALFVVDVWGTPLRFGWLCNAIIVFAQAVLMLGILRFLGQVVPSWLAPVSSLLQLGCDLYGPLSQAARDALYCAIVIAMAGVIMERMHRDTNRAQVRAMLNYIRVSLAAFTLVHLLRLGLALSQVRTGGQGVLFGPHSIPWLSLYTGLPFLIIALVALTAMSLHGSLAKSLQLEQQARASLTRFEQLMQISSAAMLMLRLGHIQDSNSRFAQMFGADRSAMQGLEFEQMFYPDEEVGAGMGAFPGQVFHRVAKRADLSHFHAEVTLLPLGNDQCLAEIRDVTQQKTMEASLTRLASVDPLTGALNRRAFFEQYTRTRAAGPDWCLAMLDLDHFKRINDQRGHSVGDEVLATFARLCLAQTRRNDLFARFGGEEFVLLLPDCDSDAGLDFLARLRGELAATAIGESTDRVRVTFSAGLVCYRPESALGEVLQQADAALYRAKEGGRDRVDTVMFAQVT